MVYSELYTQKGVKIPTFLGIALVLITSFIFGGFYLNNLGQSASADASVIKRTETANLTSSSVTIYWAGQKKGAGWLVYGESSGKLDKIANDNRDLTDKRFGYLNHFVTLKELKPNTQYFFKIIDNNRLVANSNKDAFTFKTLPDIKDSSGLRPAFGKILQENGDSARNVIVLITFTDSYPLATFTKERGDWLMPLGNIRDKKTNKLRVPANNENVKIEFISESGKISTVLTNLNKLNPIPESIIEGRDYDFSQGGEGVLGSSSKQNTPIEAISIIFPKENSIIPASNPLVRGTALSNSRVEITLRGTKTSTNVSLNADIEGSWKMPLKNNLTPGNYELTLQSKDRSGKVVVKKRKFSIAKSGERVLGVATPESALTTTPSPTTPQTETPTPTVTLSPTTPPENTSVTPTPPESGGGINAVFAASISLVVIGVGLLFLF